MARLLQQLALEKVRNHDEEGARQVLVEKAGVMEALEKGAVKAEANYTLARKLASKIADKQAALLNKVRPPTSSSSGSGSSSWSSAAPSSGSSSSSYYPKVPDILPDTGSNHQPLKWKWEQSLIEARMRLASEEAKAQAEGVGARARRSAEDAIAAAQARLGQTAQEGISAAQARLRQQAQQDIAEAQARLRAQGSKAGSSLEEARARLRLREQEVLEYVRRVMARYRRGEYVSEEELEFAFQQLEQRARL
ncbi:hypothetical protein V8C86DRAFT_995670 [Haematococcus lacustris]